LIEQSPLSIEILNPNGQIIEVNAAWKKLWGISEEETAKVLANYNMHTDKHYKSGIFAELVKRAFEGESVVLPPFKYNVDSIKNDFELYELEANSPWIQCYLFSIKDTNGKIEYIVNQYFDISGLKRNEQELLEAIITTENNERSRISKEIHDGLQQTLFISQLNLQSVKKEVDQLNSKVKEKFYTGLDYLQQSISESRTVAHNLMPKTINEYGIINAMQILVDTLNQSSEETTFQFFHNFTKDRLDNKQVEITLYRTVQESVNNIFKYAKATKVDIQLKDYEDMIMLTVEDNGIGFDLEKVRSGDNGFGLKNMQNRIDAISGFLEIESKIGKGSTIIVQIQKHI